MTTWSPSFTRETPGPIFSMMPGALVAADDREARHDVAVAQVLVGVAQARRPPSGSAPRPAWARRDRARRSPSRDPVSHSIGCPGLHEAPPPCDADGAIYRAVVSGALQRPRAARAAAFSGWRRRPWRGRRRSPAASRRDAGSPSARSRLAGGSTSWYWRSCLTRGLRRAIWNAERQPGGADLRLLRAVALGQVAELGQVEVQALGLWASRSALRRASLSSALVSRDERADRHVVGRARRRSCGAARELVGMDARSRRPSAGRSAWRPCSRPSSRSRRAGTSAARSRGRRRSGRARRTAPWPSGRRP